MRVRIARFMAVMLVFCSMLMRVAMLAIIVLGLFLPVDLTRKFFLTMHEDIDFGRADTASVYARDFQLSPDVQTSHRILEKLGRHTGIDEGAKEHIPANTGETIEIGNTHVSR